MGQGVYRAKNPAYGARLDYQLPTASSDVTLIVRNESGQAVRSLAGPGAAGLNRTAWDLRHDPLPHDTSRYDVPNLDSGSRGPLVLPGAYTVELRVNGASDGPSRPLIVRPDDRFPVSADERLARYEFTLELYALQRLAYERGVAAYDLERATDAAVDSLRALVDEEAEEGEAVAALERAEALAKEVEEMADDWREINGDLRNWWTGLIGKFDGGPSTLGSLAGPSDDQRRRLARVQEKAQAAGDALDRLTAEVESAQRA